VLLFDDAVKVAQIIAVLRVKKQQLIDV
jgi:hypothetical protein